MVPAWCRRRWRELALCGLLGGILLGVVVDVATKSCTLVEPEEHRVQRLFCEGLLNATEDGHIIDTGPFVCGPNRTTDDCELSWDGTDPQQCSMPASCLSVGFDIVLRYIAENPGLGWLVTTLLCAVLTIALIPGSVLTIGAGVAFGTALGLWKGVIVGSTAVIVGANIGADIAFLMGRFLLKEHIEHWSSRLPMIKALDRALEVKGFQVIVLLRLSPIIPFNVFNFMIGSASIPFGTYFWGTFWGILPGTFAFVLIGALVGSAAFVDTMASDVYTAKACKEDPQQKTIRTAVLAVGIAASLIAVVLLSFYARQQFLHLKEEFNVPIMEQESRDGQAGNGSPPPSNVVVPETQKPTSLSQDENHTENHKQSSQVQLASLL